jgi:hypothetical protein
MAQLVAFPSSGTPIIFFYLHFFPLNTLFLRKFHLIVSSTTGFLTNVYGPNTSTDKSLFLDSFLSLQTLTSNHHWIIGGDFNLITSLSEKQGGIRRLDQDSLSFNNVIQTLKLVDIETTNGIPSPGTIDDVALNKFPLASIAFLSLTRSFYPICIP